jgi:hypothetical protein
METKNGGGWFLRTERGKAVEYLENLLMAIIQIDLAKQKVDHSALYIEDNRNL